MKRWLLLWGLCSVMASPAAPPTDMQVFRGCRLVAADWADGDSFHVELEAGRQEVLRLYFVDCPETSAATESDQRRVREQSSYFGINDHRTTLEFGKRAAAEVGKVLGKPFTVHTAFARALGRSAKPRIYAFITMADGRDLGEYLLEKGLARSFGVRRATVDGINAVEAKEKMDDIELGAAIGRKGIWASTDAEHLVSMREARREEARQLEEAFGLQRDERINPNTATIDEMVLLPGVGPVLAKRIVDGRPYASLDDLRRVPGLGMRTFERLRDRLEVGP
ncbi:MAG: helix-hairpin-helix domain-containing protein [Chthoniobacterales bacterium]|nr:helix-hairpin-helix domain-containing protein [Chthoniobacterales bacterium]